MKSREDRLFAAYCALLETNLSHSMANAVDAVNYFDAHCPREESVTFPAPNMDQPMTMWVPRIVEDPSSDPVRAAAVRMFDVRAKLTGVLSASELRASRFMDLPAHEYDVAVADLLDAVAAERGETAEIMANPKLREALAEADRDVASGNLTNGDLLRAAKSHPAPASWLNDSKDDPFTPAPNWRALVENLKRACEEQWRDGGPFEVFDRPDSWDSTVDQMCARAVSALIAALDKPEGGWSPAPYLNKIAELTAALEATRRELANTKDWIGEILVQSVKETLAEAARRVVAERHDANLKLRACEAAIEALKGERDQLREKAQTYHDLMNAALSQRDTALAERDTLKSQLATRNELHEAAVEYLDLALSLDDDPKSGFEQSVSGFDPHGREFGRAGLRYLAAKDAAQKAGA